MDRRSWNLFGAVVIGAALTAVGCTSEDPATPPRPAGEAQPTGQPDRPAQPAPPTVAPHANGKDTIEDLRSKANGASRPYVPRPGLPTYDPTPCERKEPGWKWRGGVVNDGQCVVGPCECIEDK